jgi:hypothetical protein
MRKARHALARDFLLGVFQGPAALGFNVTISIVKAAALQCHIPGGRPEGFLAVT